MDTMDTIGEGKIVHEYCQTWGWRTHQQVGELEAFIPSAAELVDEAVG